MKLSHLTIAVSVALGLAACGGSGDDAVDNSSGNTGTTQPGNGNGGTQPGNGNGGTQPGNGNGGTQPDKQPEKPADPKRDVSYAVEKPLVADVQLAKTTYASAAARDILTGYAPNAGLVGANPRVDPRTNPGFRYVDDSTDAADVKRLSSAVNYLESSQVRTDATDNTLNGSVLANPGFTYAKGSDGVYYRVQPENDLPWDQTTPTTKYVPISASTKTSDGTTVASKFPGGSVDQDALEYLPNVTRSADVSLAIKNSGSLGVDGTPGGVDQINPRNLNVFSAKSDEEPKEQNGANLIGGQVFDYDNDNTTDATAQALTVDHGEVLFNTASFNGKKYDISTTGKIEKVDLNNLPLNMPVPLADASNTDIQYLPVSIDYSIIDSKATGTNNDDVVVNRTAKAGAMKAYNLPYSLALVTVNQKGAEKATVQDGAAARNLFDYPSSGVYGDFGSYQVVGSQTPFLPENGRADYYGKSFGVDSQGDVHLRADFGYEGAHIGGSVANRTHADGTTVLPEITLANITLSQPSRFKTTGTTAFGNLAQQGVSRSRYQTGSWDVQLFGPDAEEAGGTIVIENDSIIPGGREVFTTKRTELIDQSNIKPSGR